VPTPEQRLSRLGLLLATLVAIALRLPLLFRPLRTDEAATFLYYAARPLTVGLSVYGSPNNHILHTALMHVAWRLFGPAEWALRLPAFLAGVALVPLAYFTARALARPLTRPPATLSPLTRGEGKSIGGGLIAAALVATLPILVDYSTDARGYTLVCAFTLLALLAAVPLRERGDRTSALAFALCIALGLWTIPIMIYPFVMLATWTMASRHWRSALAVSAAAVALALGLYSPVLVVSGLDAVTSNPWVRPVPWSAFFANLPRMLAGIGSSWMTAVPLSLAILLALAFLVSVIRNRMTLWLGLLPAIAIVIAQHTIPFPRTWLPLLVLAAVSIDGFGLRWQSHRFRDADRKAVASPPQSKEGLVALALALVLSWYTVRTSRRPETGELPHVREIATFLRTNAQPADAIGTLSPSDVPLAFYLDARALRPDIGARRIFVVTNEEYGQFLAKTLFELNLDPRRYTVAKRVDFGDAAVYQLDRR
jgi:4-amino-4-deoxy-L-arabinose transferase-like glycosyltransferase